jgi:probable HAF family extracellular repeat protein
MRCFTCAIAIVLMFSGLNQPVQAAPYLLTGLGTLGGHQSYAGRINERGQIVGAAETGNGYEVNSFVFQNGQMTDLGFHGVEDINDHGVMAGRVELNDSYGHAFVFENGKLTILPTPGPHGSQATAIDNEGRVVGDSGFPGFVQTQAFAYQRGQVVRLGSLGGDLSQAMNVNNNGQIVGFATTSGNASHAFLFDNGIMQDLGTLGGTSSLAYAINDHGQIVGQAELAGGGLHAFLYDGVAMTDLGTLGASSVAHDINNQGQVVGHSRLPGAPSQLRAFLYDNGAIKDLNDLIEPGSGWTLQFAGGINDSGWIAG